MPITQFKGMFIFCLSISLGNYQPSQWKWYHRHGYWATRRKNLDFTRFRSDRYHEVRGPGKNALRWFQNPSYYKSLNKSVRFW